MTEPHLTERTPTSEKDAIESIKRRLTAFFEKYAAIAGQSIAKVRFMFIISLGAGCWLTFYFAQLMHLPIFAVIPVFLVLALPALLLLKLFLTLTDVMELPDQVHQIVEAMKGKAQAAKSRIMDQLPETDETGKKRAKLKDLFAMSKSLIEIKQVVGDISGMSGAFAGALLLASPVFMVLIVLSTALTGLLTLLTLITGLFFIF